jgi:hypothetical protein
MIKRDDRQAFRDLVLRSKSSIRGIRDQRSRGQSWDGDGIGYCSAETAPVNGKWCPWKESHGYLDEKATVLVGIVIVPR